LYAGGGVSIAFDKDGLDRYDDIVTEAKTTKGIRRIMRKSVIVRDESSKCLLEVEITSNGMNIRITRKFSLQELM